MNHTILLRFSKRSNLWYPDDIKYNVLYVDGVRLKLNAKLNSVGYVTLFDVEEELDISAKPSDAMIGWIKGETKEIHFDIDVICDEVRILLTTEHEFDADVEYENQIVKEVI